MIHQQFEWLLRATWQASVLAVVVLAAQWIFGRRLAAQWRCYLWLVVACRFVLPFSFQSPVSVFNLAARQQAPTKQTTPTQPTSPGSIRFESSVRIHAAAPAPAGANQIHSAMATGRFARSLSSRFQTFQRSLPLVWLAGAGTLAFWTLFCSACLAWRLRSAALIDDAALVELLKQCAKEMGIRRRVLVVESKAVTSPALHGIWRPRLILPPGLSRSLSSEQLRFVFLHEMAHIRRCDIGIGWLMTGIQIVHWFNPVAWLAARYVRIERELACDALVLGRAGVNQRKPYGETILRLALEMSRPVQAPGMVGILQDGCGLRRRMKLIADFTPRSSAGWSALVFVIIAAIGLTDAMTLSRAGTETLEKTGSQEPTRQTGFRLTIDLRDGSRVVGKSREDHFQFRSDVLGKFELPLEKLRAIECQPRTHLAKLTTANADNLRAKLAMKDIRVETSFGNADLPVETIRSIQVSAMGTVGRLTDGLIARWSGNGNAVDSVGGNNGVTQNVSFTDGVAGQAFLFAPDNYPWGTYCGVQIPDRPVFELTHSLSIECWIRPRSHSAYVIFFRGDHRPGLDPYCLSMDGNQNLVFAVCDSAGNDASVRAPVALGGWIHVAGVLDDNTDTLSLYTNGVLAAEITTTVRPYGKLLKDQFPGIGIGNVNDGGNNFPFAGEIEEVGLYNRALSQDEVNALYAEHEAEAGSRAEPLAPRSTPFDNALSGAHRAAQPPTFERGQK